MSHTTDKPQDSDEAPTAPVSLLIDEANPWGTISKVRDALHFLTDATTQSNHDDIEHGRWLISMMMVSALTHAEEVNDWSKRHTTEKHDGDDTP